MAITTLATVKAAIETQVATITSFTKLKHVTDPSKESYKSANNKYGVRFLSGVEEEGNYRSVRYAVPVEITLTKVFNNSHITDNADTIEVTLQQNILDIYKQLQNTKAGSPANVVQVTDLTVAESDILEDDKIIIVKGTCLVRFNFSLD